MNMGYHPVDKLVQADLIIINTCAIREKAVNKAYGMIGRAYHEKKLRSQTIVGVTGCVVEIEKERILQRKGVDFALGTRSLDQLPGMISKASMGKQSFSVGDGVPEIQSQIPRLRKSPHHAWITIIHGCDRFCSYCVVPYARGREKSRQMSDILCEVTRWAKEGTQEITFLGQNVDAYGSDRPEDNARFSTLLAEASKIEGIERIWFMTSYPSDFTSELIDTIASIPKIARSIHLPVQSGSDSILKKMNRRYSRLEYLDLLKSIRNRIPDASISSDVIVGFPTESESDFGETVSLVREARFERLNLAMFSPRPRTVAAEKYLNDVSECEKNRRLRFLLELQKSINAETNKPFLGASVEVMVESQIKPASSLYYGRTNQNKIVIFPATPEEAGKRVRVRIEKTTAGPLYGSIMEGVAV